MTQRERMIKGLIYDPADEELMNEQIKCRELLEKFNRTFEQEKRCRLMKKMFGSIGENCYIEGAVYANWGCRHVFMGNEVYANFNLTLIDDGNIYIGDCVMFGPNVTVATPNHPIEPSLRTRKYQFNRDVHIGRNVWIGANSVIVPGVTIGENSVIGAGSVVTKDIPPNVVAYGNPCRVAREIGEHDREYYYRSDKIDWESFTRDSHEFL